MTQPEHLTDALAEWIDLQLWQVENVVNANFGVDCDVSVVGIGEERAKSFVDVQDLFLREEGAVLVLFKLVLGEDRVLLAHLQQSAPDDRVGVEQLFREITAPELNFSSAETWRRRRRGS